jgi:uncharacterized C2H2 Zn-finger protein
MLLSAAHAPPPTSPVSSYSVPHPHGSARPSNDHGAPPQTPWTRPSELTMSHTLPPLSLGPPLAPLPVQFPPSRYHLPRVVQEQNDQRQQQGQCQQAQPLLRQPQAPAQQMDERGFSGYCNDGDYIQQNFSFHKGRPERPVYTAGPQHTLPTSLPRPHEVMVTHEDEDCLHDRSGSIRARIPAVTVSPHSPASSSQRDNPSIRHPDTSAGTHDPRHPLIRPVEQLELYHDRENVLGNKNESATVADGGHSGKIFQCTVPGCDATFGQKGSLTRHVKNRHSLNCRPHSCDQCSKSFSEKWTLNVHRRNVHLKLKAHNCPQCNKSFGEKWNLRKHVNVVHLHVKPFSCHICDRAFGYKGDMVKHVAELHSSSSALRPFICDAPGCGVKFARMRYLRRHQNLTHKDMEVDSGPAGGVVDREDSAAVSPTTPMSAAAPQSSEPVVLLPEPRSMQKVAERPQGHVNNLSLFAAVASSTSPQGENGN